MQTNCNIEAMRRPRPVPVTRKIVRVGELKESIELVVAKLRQNGVVDPGLAKCTVKNGSIEIGLRYCTALDECHAQLTGLMVLEGGHKYSRWELRVNRQCFLSWLKPETLEDLNELRGDVA